MKYILVIVDGGKKSIIRGMKLNKEREAEALGGSDIEFRLEYESNDASPYFNKENHFKRSLCHQPNHKRVAKKIKLLEEGHELSF